MQEKIASVDPKQIGQEMGKWFVQRVSAFRYLAWDEEKRIFSDKNPLDDCRETNPAKFREERMRYQVEKSVALSILPFLAFIQAQSKDDRDDIIEDAFERKQEAIEQAMRGKGIPNVGGFPAAMGEHQIRKAITEHYLKYRVIFENAAIVIDKELKIS